MLAEMCPSAVSALGLILSTQELPGVPLVSLLLESPADRYLDSFHACRVFSQLKINLSGNKNAVFGLSHLQKVID